MVEVAAQAPTFATRAPDVLNNGTRVSISLPLLNSGTGDADNFTITNVTLGPGHRLEPVLPLLIGDVAASNSTSLNSVFSSTGLTVGGRYTLVVTGTYQLGASTFGFSVNRPLVIPAVTPQEVALLAAHLQVVVDPNTGTWNYTIFNDETAGSPLYVAAVSIDMLRPFVVANVPAGWAADSDNATYVLFYATDTALPYPNQVAPGASEGGFQIQPTTPTSTSEGRAYTITSWNHTTDQADLVNMGTTFVPAHA